MELAEREIKDPKKGEGVPRETLERNSLAALREALVPLLPPGEGESLERRLRQKGYFAAGMQAQVRMMAEEAVTLAKENGRGDDVLQALSTSPVEKVRGVAAFSVRLLGKGDPKSQLELLAATAVLPGTWPRELSANLLHEWIAERGPEILFAEVAPWLSAKEPALRRVVTEAFRPRGVMLAHLPVLKKDPTLLFSMVEPLLEDPSDYVRKSVANLLNDVSKDNPDLLLERVRFWLQGKPSKWRRWILERALRTLIDEGRPEALALSGFSSPELVQVKWVGTLPERVVLNQLLAIELQCTAPSTADALVFALLEMEEPGRGNARRRSRYQLFKGRVKAGELLHVIKKVHLVDRNRQPRLPGTYTLSLLVNGELRETRNLTFIR